MEKRGGGGGRKAGMGVEREGKRERVDDLVLSFRFSVFAPTKKIAAPLALEPPVAPVPPSAGQKKLDRLAEFPIP